MNDNTQGDPRDAVEDRPQRPAKQPSQEVFGPTESLQRSGLDLGMLRMEMESSMEFALAHRRVIDVVQDQIREMALHNDAAASRCVYALPRADKAIIGPSIGLATIIATAWGNCIDGGWFIRTDRTDKVVICAGAFFDFQTNRRSWATVTRRISGRSGMIYNDDMIAVTIQAATAIAQRNAILKGVPSPIWRPVYEEALVVVRGTEQTLPERRSKMIAAFANFGVKPERVLLALGAKKEAEITLDHMVMLRGMYEQLKEDQITAEEMFDPRRMTGHGFEMVENPLADQDEDPEAPPRSVATPQPRATTTGPALATQTRTAEPKQAEPAPAQQVAQEEPEKPAGEPAKETAPEAAPAQELAQEPPQAETEASKPAPKPRAAPKGKAAAAPEAPIPAADAPKVPKNAEEYLNYFDTALKGFVPGQHTEAEFANWRRSERALRSTCGVADDDLTYVFAECDKKQAELRAGAKVSS